jgi:hypothetical protein
MIDFVKPQGSKENSQAAADATDSHAKRVNLFHNAHAHSAALDITKSASLTLEAWKDELEEAKHKPWNSTVMGRGMIRLFSRGVLGATAYAIGGRIASDSLRTYNRNVLPAAYDLPKRIAYNIDHLIGTPIHKTGRWLGYTEEAMNEFLRFRPTHFHRGKTGITLGHEAVSITFDFATMSIGDGIGRDLANALDPNRKQNWVDDKGHINYTQVLKNVGYNTWKYLTYNQGEDWAVAIPYTFFVRAQRNFIDKRSPGFGYDSDRRLNGGSFKINDRGEVTGTYGFEGAMDLQSRFTVYNIGTVMFREAYTSAAHHLESWYKSGFQLPTLPASVSDVSNSVTGFVGNTIRWAARDVVKGALYMTPAVPAFWMFRTPQTKYRGMFIHPGQGVIAYRTGMGARDVDIVHAYESRRFYNLSPLSDRDPAYRFTGNSPTFFSAHDGTDWRHGEAVANPLAPYVNRVGADGKPETKYPSYERTYGVFDSLTNPLGAINNKLRKKGHYTIGKIKEYSGVELNTKELRAKRFADAVINASFAYTPYFFMKSDVMAAQWDTGKMDMAIERTIDGVSSFQPNEIKEGLGEIWSAMWHKPFKDPVREVQAQQRICNDKSPPDGQLMSENKRCLDKALQDISLHSQYHRQADTKQFVERLQDSKKRSQNMLDGFKNDVARKFTDAVTPRNRMTEASEDSFIERERWRKAQSRDDFPDIGTTVH